MIRTPAPRLLSALTLALALSAQAALAVLPDEMLSDPAQEARARALSTGLRCLVCRNQSIDDSDADLARDLRILLRERIKSGDTDEEAVAYLVERYGNFILLKPPVTPLTWALWGGPLIFVALGALGFATLWSRRKPEPVPDLTEEDRAAALAALNPPLLTPKDSA